MTLIKKSTAIVPVQEPEVRINNWEQVEGCLSRKEAIEEAHRCVDCFAHGCERGCPVSIPIHEVLEHVKRGWMRKAVNLARSYNLLLAITSLVCPQSEQCEAGCVIKRSGNDPVFFGAIERFLYEWECANGGPQIPELAKENGKRIALVGSGPASFTNAAFLRVYGYHVDIFEALPVAGGVLMYGIPEFRLPKKIVQNEIDFIRSFGGIEIYTSTSIGKRFTVAELRKEYDAIFFATGAGKPIPLGIPGEDTFGVMSANQWLFSVNFLHANDSSYETHIPDFKHIAVVGGGNVAMDSVRAGKRVLTEKIQTVLAETSAGIIYRRDERSMPARVQEIHHGKEEHMELLTQVAPVRILSKDGRVCGLECVKTELGEPDEKGRRTPVNIEGSNFIVETDLVISALGNKPNPTIIEQMGDVVLSKGYVSSINGCTSVPGFFVGGDLSGGGTVIRATGDGKIAAASIHNWLQGKYPWPKKEEFKTSK
ncbi:MAG: FAD-dependent oxidoreductase [Candidatus Paceibacterota bacterium]|jgi:glutamate synthase (NADPH/NADH) small chain|nr:FAD-dependent oxidoreductase [Candidatus Paceibacterota bacterium]